MGFDEVMDRFDRGTAKWDGMKLVTGVDAPDGLPMWIADMDFAPAEILQRTVQDLHDKGAYGYFVGQGDYHKSVAWWMRERHGWEVSMPSILSTYGLGNAIAMCLHTYTQPGDEVIIFTPVYLEFSQNIRRGGRVVRESPLVVEDGVYRMDLAALENSLTGREKVVLFCSPHNPAGRVWSVEEQKELADFCARHDLLLIVDEIHHDLVYSDHKHVPFAVAAPDSVDRLVMLTAASKTFNIAGTRIGNVIVPDRDLRAPFENFLKALDIKPNLFGLRMAQAVYSPEGAVWVDALVAYIEENSRILSDGLSKIPGVSVMPMQATYLSWVDFTNTGMEMEEVVQRVKGDAKIAPSVGAEFGVGGATYLRFNIGTQRARIKDAIARMHAAFSDLQ